MFYTYTAYLLPSILEPTLNDLVGLKTPEDPWPVTSITSESSATPSCPIRRIGMKDIEQPDGNLQGGPHFSLSIFDEPKFYNADTNLWRYWPANLAHSTPGLAFPKEGDSTVDPWDVLSHQDPPFYRRLCTEAPYESGTHRPLMVDQDSQTPSPGHQIGNLKASPAGSHCNTAHLHSHL